MDKYMGTHIPLDKLSHNFLGKLFISSNRSLNLTFDEVKSKFKEQQSYQENSFKITYNMSIVPRVYFKSELRRSLTL